jgi:hypothetical protein
MFATSQFVTIIVTRNRAPADLAAVDALEEKRDELVEGVSAVLATLERIDVDTYIR